MSIANCLLILVLCRKNQGAILGVELSCHTIAKIERQELDILFSHKIIQTTEKLCANIKKMVLAVVPQAKTIRNYLLNQALCPYHRLFPTIC